MNDQLHCLAKVIVETMTADYSKLIAKIRKHEFFIAALNSRQQGHWYKIMFVTTDTCVVQKVELMWGATRFEVTGIPLSEWESSFEEWIDPGHKEYVAFQECWESGFRMFGM